MASLSLVGSDSSPAYLEFISLPHATSRITIDRSLKWIFNEDTVMSISPLDFHTSAEKTSFQSLRIQGNFYYKNQPQWMLWWQEQFWQQPTDWTDNSISTCGGISMLGGFGKFAGGEVQKTFIEIPDHTKVRIVANYHFIDGWGGETGFLRASVGRLDAMEYVWTEKYDYSRVKNGISVCGNRYPEGKLTSPIDVTFPHTKDTLKLGFGSTLDNDPLENSFGISNLQIYLM